MPANQESTQASEDVIALATQLVRIPSITPEDGGCLDIIAERLSALGFQCRKMIYGDGSVQNLWCTHYTSGTDSQDSEQAPLPRPIVALVGHTDVVPTGPVDAWSCDPFGGEIKDGHLWGRGTADMKGGVAALVTAMEAFVRERPTHPGTLALMLTSDEEGPAIDGLCKVAETLHEEGNMPDHCLIGEPSSETQELDQIRIGRRGSLNCKLQVAGVQGHVAYPDKVVNPVHGALDFLKSLTDKIWDEGHDGFPPTSFQISNISAGTGAANVVPGNIEVDFNLRYSPAQTAESLIQQIEAMTSHQGLEINSTSGTGSSESRQLTHPSASFSWHISARPFYTAPDAPLVEACCQAVKEHTDKDPVLSTSGGTSDGRFLVPLGAAVVELGPCNDSIHSIDERVSLKELRSLQQIYLGVVRRLL